MQEAPKASRYSQDSRPTMNPTSFSAAWIRASMAGLLVLWLALQLAAAEQAGNSRWPKSERFEKAILAYEAADKTSPPPQNAILFTGASNIVGWKTLVEDFPGLAVINRGFGGSHIADCVFYADRIVIPSKPRMIVFRAAGNDIQAGKTPPAPRSTSSAAQSL